MKTVNIKGKDYVEVNERVKFFRFEEEEYKGWSIETELLSNQDGLCVFKATIKDDNGNVRSTGHAYEKESSSFINKTSYIENCETSAVGRALGFLGIGIDTSIASGDEVINAINNQGQEYEEKTKRKGIDFNEVRAEIKNIETVEELNKYWSDLKLSDAQQKILLVDFKVRKNEIGG